MASSVPPKKGVAYSFYHPLVSQANTKVFQDNPTLAAGDVKVSIDDGASANITDLPVVDAGLTKRIKVTLTAEEMDGDHITILFSDAAGAEWCDLMLEIETVSDTLDELATQLDAIEGGGVSITRSTGALVGTAEGNGVTLAAGAEAVGSEVDLLADNTSTGIVHIYISFTQATRGSLYLQLYRRRVSGVAYSNLIAGLNINPTSDSANQYIYVGQFPATRYMNAKLSNTGSVDLTNIAVLYELEKTG